MRLATWNCRQGIDRKRAAIDAIGADVLVLQECHEHPMLVRELGVSFLWRGEYASKGLAVVARGGWCVEAAEAPVELPWVLPVRVIDPEGRHRFNLLAVWTVQRRSGRASYAGQVSQLIDVWGTALETGGTVMAGDLNCSMQGPSSEPHASNLLRLQGLGLRSAYHAHAGVEHGEEPAMTLRWIAPGRAARGYHCDFVFLPEPLLERTRRAAVGSFTDWIETGLSDHCPVSVDVELDGFKPTT